MQICIMMPSGKIYPITCDYTGSLHPIKVLETLGGVPLDRLTSVMVEKEDALMWGTAPIRVMAEVVMDTPAEAARRTVKSPEDGWGHSLQDSCVEDTLRELLASEQGTDKHEELMKRYLGEGGEKVLLTMLSKDFYAYKASTDARIEGLTKLHQDLNSRFNAQTLRLRTALGVPELPDPQDDLGDLL